MRFSAHLALVAALAFGVTGCGASPGAALETRFKTPLPNDVAVEDFYREPFDDSRALWILSPIRQDFLDALIANASLKPAAEGAALSKPNTAGLPAWWDQETVRAIPELYFRNPGVIDDSIYQVWADRKAGKLYILFVDPYPER